MEVSTPEGSNSKTVNLVGARRKKVRTSISGRLHIYLNYLLSYRQQDDKTKNQPTKSQISASSYDQIDVALRNHKSQEWHHLASALPDLNRHRLVILRNT